MYRKFSVKSPLQIVAGVAIIFMFLNAFLPLPIEAEATEYPFKLTIALEKTMYKLGELINVTWILTNIGKENITLYHSADILLDFTVYDENFNHVYRYRSDHLTPAIYYPFNPIPPGDNVTLTGFWDQIYDGSGNVMPELWGKEIPPGIYYLSGIFPSTTYHIMLQTPAIRFRIVGR